MLWLGLLVVVGVFGVFVFRSIQERERFRQAQAAIDAEADARREEERLAAERADPLVAPFPETELALRAQELLAEFDGVTTFADVARWDSEASSTAEAMSRTLDDLEEWVAHADEEIARAKAATGGDALARRGAVLKTHSMVNKARSMFSGWPRLIDELAERIELTPNSKGDQKAMLRDLRAEKKELQLQKREAKSRASEIRREARVATAEVTPVWATRYYRAVAAEEKRAIRRAKEAALGPHEDLAAALDRQILAVERRIAWVSRFGEG